MKSEAWLAGSTLWSYLVFVLHKHDLKLPFFEVLLS